jgi:uncharacterized GH25 family protein
MQIRSGLFHKSVQGTPVMGPAVFEYHCIYTSQPEKTSAKPNGSPPAPLTTIENTAKPAGDPSSDTGAWKPGQVLDFRVVNARTKEPLPDVKLLVMFPKEKDKTQTTDAKGRAEIQLPDQRPSWVRIYPTKAGFVPLRVYWGDDLPAPKLPRTVTVPMEPGQVWGSVVQNEKDEPIPNVKVTLFYFESGSEPNPHLRVNIRDEIAYTDKGGRWRVDIMPAKFTGEGPRIYVTHPDYVSDHLRWASYPKPITERPPYKALREQIAVMVMRKGATIAGRVTDESGKPISGALICNQYDCYDPDPLKITATTDNEGRFRLSGLSHRRNYRDHFFTVQAAGYTPVFVEVSDRDSAKPVEITLKRGQPVEGQVVDEDGKPLEGVSLKLDYWVGHPRQFHLKTTTDANGRFCINDAPLGPTQYDFEKKGYITVRTPLTPSSEDYRITLRPPVWIVGSIVDVEIGQPLEECTLTTGWDVEDGRAPQWLTHIGYPAKRITDGRYEVEITQERYTARIRVEAEGYMPAVSRIFKPYNPDRGRVTYDFKLKKANPLTGTVLSSDGKPLANADVFLATQPFKVKDRKASPRSPRSVPMAHTDPVGRFELPPEVEPFYLVVLHDQGCAVIDEKQFADNPTIRTEPWTTGNRSFRIERSRPTSP